MCLTPFILKNPNYGNTVFETYCRKDTVSAYISVPCGVCPECTSLRQTYWVQRCQLMTLNYYVFFGTLTYRNTTIQRTEDYVHDDGTVRNYMYADVRDFRLMIKRLRKERQIPEGCKYICCSEYGGRTHRPHFHFLLFVPKPEKFGLDSVTIYDKYFNPHCLYSRTREGIVDEFYPVNLHYYLFHNILFQWRRNTSNSTKKPVYVDLCKYVYTPDGRRTYDLQYAGSEDSAIRVSQYVTKYILKFDKWVRRFRQSLHENLSPEDYIEVWKLVRPRMLVSACFAGIDESLPSEVVESMRDYVRKALDYASENGWRLCFRSMKNGSMMPLSRYLRDKYLTSDEVLKIMFERMAIDGETPYDDHIHFDSASRAAFDHHDFQYRFRESVRYRKVFDFLDYCNRQSDVQFLIE